MPVLIKETIVKPGGLFVFDSFKASVKEPKIKDFDNFELCFRIANKIYARVVKWQTRKHEGLVPQGLGVQLPPRALIFKVLSGACL